MGRRPTTNTTNGWLEGPGPEPDLGTPRAQGGRSAALVIAVLAILLVVAL
jgi:hypothetical protein